MLPSSGDERAIGLTPEQQNSASKGNIRKMCSLDVTSAGAGTYTMYRFICQQPGLTQMYLACISVEADCHNSTLVEALQCLHGNLVAVGQETFAVCLQEHCGTFSIVDRAHRHIQYSRRSMLACDSRIHLFSFKTSSVHVRTPKLTCEMLGHL